MKKEKWKRIIGLCMCLLTLCTMVSGCGAILRKVAESLDSPDGTMRFEDKELGFSIQIPYEWETEPLYADNGGVVWFTPDPEVYGRDDLQMAVLYLPGASYTESVKNLRDFISVNVLGEQNRIPFDIIGEENVTRTFGDAYAVGYRLNYPKGGSGKFRMYIVPGEKGVYTLHFNGMDEENQQFIEEAEKAVDTFSIGVGRMTPNDYRMAESPYLNETLGFSIEYIANWKINEASEDANGGTVELLSADADGGTGKLTIRYTTKYGLADAMDAFHAAVGEKHVKVLNENYVNAPSMDLSYGALCESQGENGKTVTTQLYIIPDEGNACYFAYYSWDDTTDADFQKQCEINLQGFRMVGSTIEGHVSTGDQAMYPYGTEFDFTMITEKGWTPEDIKAKYGQPTEVGTSQIGSALLTDYVYEAFTVSFEERNGTLAAAGLLNTSPESPVGIAGFQAGTSPEDADDGLRASGYKERKDLLTEDRRYYSGKSLDGKTCLVILYLNHNIVGKAQGWYGDIADLALEEAQAGA